MGQALSALIGLGNPGSEHASTRHNAGFWFVDRVAARWGCEWRREPRFSAVAGRVRIEDHEFWLVKPLTFMNASGTTVASLCRYFRLTAADILVAHDELDLMPGTVRLKQGGGAGGHQGLTDIIDHVGREFWRLRIGIGRPPPRRDLVPYVLGRPGRDEQVAIEDAMDRALAVLPGVLGGASAHAMNLLHRTDGEVSDGT
ncbi:MAG: aminoacyl-tRNA hydrolase [Acidiferrobacter sp.]